MLEISRGIFKKTNNNEIYVIGDIHGDYQCLIHCLVDLCNVCDMTNVFDDKKNETINREHLEWKVNNNSILVFCGDFIHRKRFDHVMDDECSDVYIIETLLRLKLEAIKYNGNIIIIAGNHEIMNIVNPSDRTYTSPKNIRSNLLHFSNKQFINNFVNNSYAWIKINDILISHGGLCTEYLKYLDINKLPLNLEQEKIGDAIIEYINKEYLNFFTNFDANNLKQNTTGYNLFVEYDLNNKHKHNMFWCRQWGYGDIDCDTYNKMLNQVKCKKMIISH